MTEVFAFDAYGTLFDVASAIGVHRESVGPDADAFAALWRSKQLEYTWTLTMMGRYEDFWTLTTRALDFCLARYPLVDGSLRQPLLDAYQVLGAYADVAPTLERLRSNGARIAVFTNGTRGMVTNAIAAAGVSSLIDDVVSLDVARTFKTVPRAYDHLCMQLGVSASEITLVSSNRWDVAGGVSFGLSAVWCNRTNMPDEYSDLSPSRTVSTLSEI